MTAPSTRPKVALALSGGAARGLASIGVIDVLSREGIQADFVAGSSMGGLIGSLLAAGLDAGAIATLARTFHFPRRFIPGGFVPWDRVFPAAMKALAGRDFASLAIPLALTAVDLESGHQVVLHGGPVLPAVRATCAVPGAMPPIKIDGRWLVDGGLTNILPVDVAWMVEPDVVIAVRTSARRERKMPQLDWWATTLLYRLGMLVPNPATAKVAFEVLVRAAEIAIDHAGTLVGAMASPDLLIEPDVGDFELRDFHRLDEAIDAGRRAADAALPALRVLLAKPARFSRDNGTPLSLMFDPVCAMVISQGRARAKVEHAGQTYYFCSPNCGDAFERDAGRFLAAPALACGVAPIALK